MKSGAAQRLDFRDLEGLTPESFLADIRASLEAGSQQAAREHAERGLAFFPDHPRLQRLHWSLRPGETRTVPGENTQPDRRDSFQWIRENAGKYKRQWIAVLGPSLVAASPELDEVLQAIREMDLPETPVLLFVA
ncbi:MAG TPA: hypothetical protein VL025_14165, partial [Thermoanaerobaculia bacterium]|nr:hypothetical protein [Thermoanaerobaculia bacterium]